MGELNKTLTTLQKAVLGLDDNQTDRLPLNASMQIRRMLMMPGHVWPAVLTPLEDAPRLLLRRGRRLLCKNRRRLGANSSARDSRRWNCVDCAGSGERMRRSETV
jgi:hypothetical protein